MALSPPAPFHVSVPGPVYSLRYKRNKNTNVHYAANAVAGVLPFPIIHPSFQKAALRVVTRAEHCARRQASNGDTDRGWPGNPPALVTGHRVDPHFPAFASSLIGPQRPLAHLPPTRHTCCFNRQEPFIPFIPSLPCARSAVLACPPLSRWTQESRCQARPEGPSPCHAPQLGSQEGGPSPARGAAFPGESPALGRGRRVKAVLLCLPSEARPQITVLLYFPHFAVSISLTISQAPLCPFSQREPLIF